MGAGVVLHAERARVRTVRTPVATVRVVRRVLTETVQVPVTVRREVLEVTRTELDPDSRPRDGAGQGGGADVAAAGAGGSGAGRVEVVLREEVPVVDVRVRAYERVTVEVVDVAGEVAVDVDLRREVADVEAPPNPT